MELGGGDVTCTSEIPALGLRCCRPADRLARRNGADLSGAAGAYRRARSAGRTHPEQGFRACIGIMRLVKSYGAERLEAACGRALEIGARSYSSVNSILKTNRDRQRLAPPTDEPAIIHDNIRGPRYFH